MLGRAGFASNCVYYGIESEPGKAGWLCACLYKDMARKEKERADHVHMGLLFRGMNQCSCTVAVQTDIHTSQYMHSVASSSAMWTTFRAQTDLAARPLASLSWDLRHRIRVRITVHCYPRAKETWLSTNIELTNHLTSILRVEAD